MPEIKSTSVGLDKITETVGEVAPKIVPPVVKTVGDTATNMTKDISSAAKDSITEVTDASTEVTSDIKSIVLYIVIRISFNRNNCFNYCLFC